MDNMINFYSGHKNGYASQKIALSIISGFVAGGISAGIAYNG